MCTYGGPTEQTLYEDPKDLNLSDIFSYRMEERALLLEEVVAKLS